MKYYYIIFSLILIYSCKNSPKTTLVQTQKYDIVGQIERIDSRIDAIIPKDAQIEHIATGLTWAEGPLWVESEKMLLCSDVKMDKIYKWTEAEGMSVYIEPSGFTGIPFKLKNLSNPTLSQTLKYKQIIPIKKTLIESQTTYV